MMKTEQNREDWGLFDVENERGVGVIYRGQNMFIEDDT